MQQYLPQLEWDSEAERELWADVCYHSFWWFCREAVGLDRYPKAKNWFQEYIHKPLCDWYQEHVLRWLAQREAPDATQLNLMVLVPREFAKTTVITRAGQLWLHLRDPEMSSYTGSETVSQAVKWMAPLIKILEGDEEHARFAWLYGNWYDPKRLWRQNELVHGARKSQARPDPSLSTWGVATGLTGTHPDALFFDDPISYDALRADANWFDKVREHVGTLVPVLRKDGLMVWVGTRYGEGDHFGHAFHRYGVLSVDGHKMPHAVLGKEPKWHVYYMTAELPPYDDNGVGTPTFPEQWPKWRLRESLVESAGKHAAQLRNDPESSEYNPLTRAEIMAHVVNAKDVPMNQLWISIQCDTAFKYEGRQNRGDESVLLVFGHLRGTGTVYYLEGYGSNAWDSIEFNRRLILLVQKYQVARRKIIGITDEMEQWGKAGSWEQLIRKDMALANVISPPIYLLNRGGRQKEARIAEAKNYIGNGYLKLIQGAPGLDELIDQASKPFLQLAHDDRIDACADVFHPKIYMPARRGGYVDEQPVINNPYDEYLKVGYMTDDIAVRIYDMHNRQRESTDSYAVDYE